ARGGFARAAVDLGHQQDLRAVPVAQRLAHAQLAAAVVIVPAVVHERDAVIDRLANDADALPLVGGPPELWPCGAADPPALPRPPECAVEHVAPLDGGAGDPCTRLPARG